MLHEELIQGNGITKKPTKLMVKNEQEKKYGLSTTSNYIFFDSPACEKNLTIHSPKRLKLP